MHKDKDGQSTSGQMGKNSDKGPESGNEYSFFSIMELVIIVLKCDVDICWNEACKNDIFTWYRSGN